LLHHVGIVLRIPGGGDRNGRVRRRHPQLALGLEGGIEALMLMRMRMLMQQGYRDLRRGLGERHGRRVPERERTRPRSHGRRRRPAAQKQRSLVAGILEPRKQPRGQRGRDLLLMLLMQVLLVHHLLQLLLLALHAVWQQDMQAQLARSGRHPAAARLLLLLLLREGSCCRGGRVKAAVRSPNWTAGLCGVGVTVGLGRHACGGELHRAAAVARGHRHREAAVAQRRQRPLGLHGDGRRHRRLEARVRGHRMRLLRGHSSGGA
jgi:hypothetical protein